MFIDQRNETCKGTVIVDQTTKRLLTRIKAGQIAVLCHEDLDELAAQDLVAARVQAVINTAPSISGRYPSGGARRLFEQGIPLYDCQRNLLDRLQDGDRILIRAQRLYHRGLQLASLQPVDQPYIEHRLEVAVQNIDVQLTQFIENTLDYAALEKRDYIDSLVTLPLTTRLRDRPVLVVVRGTGYREDLATLHTYIQEHRPLLFGVDGGADALLEQGWTPDLILGDMDSVSDAALYSGAELIVHAYPNGHTPGKHRLQQLRLPFHTLPAPGMSEDVALWFAYEQGAKWIVAVGTHSSMIDFLEKGREGMASTMLVRMKVGDKLMDAKGIHRLYERPQIELGPHHILPAYLEQADDY